MWSLGAFSSQWAVGGRGLAFAGCQQGLAMCPPTPQAPAMAQNWVLQRPGGLLDKLTYINHSRTHPFFNRLHHLLLLEDHPRSSPLKKGLHKPTDAGHSGQGDHLNVCLPHFQALSVICWDYFLCSFFFFNDQGCLYLNILTYTHHTHTFPAMSRVDQIICSSPSQPRLIPNIMY